MTLNISSIDIYYGLGERGTCISGFGLGFVFAFL